MKNKTTIDNIKWQLHTETSVSNIFMWIIMWKLFGGWVTWLSIFMILGNIFTVVNSVRKLGNNYFK